MNRYLVVGANSFSGSHFVAHLLSLGHTVLGISRSPEPDKAFLPRLWNQQSGSYEFWQLDLNQLGEELQMRLLSWKPEYVVNFAAQGMVAESWNSPWDWFNTNTVGLSRFLEVVAALPSLLKYVHVSTPEVYGSTNGWTRECWNFQPSTPYATSRAAGDWHVANLAKVKGLPAVITRAANVYGPGQQLYRVIPRAFLAGLLGEPFPMHGTGHTTRSFIHIRDVVEATYQLSRSDSSEMVFHISTKRLVSIQSLVETIGQMLPRGHSIEIEQKPERDGKDSTYQLDSGLLRDNLNWSDTVSLADGLQEVLGWLQENLEFMKLAQKRYIHKV